MVEKKGGDSTKKVEYQEDVTQNLTPAEAEVYHLLTAEFLFTALDHPDFKFVGGRSQEHIHAVMLFFIAIVKDETKCG